MKGLKTIALLIAAALVCSCSWFGSGSSGKKYDKVLIVYGAGFNDLSRNILDDIEEMKKSELPSKNAKVAIVLVTHNTASVRDGTSSIYKTANPPRVIRLYKNRKGAVLDTLFSYTETDLLTNPEIMRSSLDYVAEQFKSDHYGLVLSSHGTGWLPPGYYLSPSTFDKTYTGKMGSARIPGTPNSFPSVDTVIPGPLVRSFGEEVFYEGKLEMRQYVDIRDFGTALPYHFDYIIFDACLMGGVEVAYELKDKCDYLAVSPAEILAAGLIYTDATSTLLKSGKSDVEAFIESSYNLYAGNEGAPFYNSFTFALIDCSKLDQLAAACRLAFEKNRDAIANLKKASLQRYYRYDYHWFYDLRDILVKAGANDYLPAVDAALAQCIVKEYHTDEFLINYGGFKLTSVCGLSMFLPCDGSTYLRNWYKSLGWNKATSLVQ